MHCSFAFPESIPRPYPGDEMDVGEALDEELDEDLLLEDEPTFEEESSLIQDKYRCRYFSLSSSIKYGKE